VDDVVMGGRSNGNFTINSEGHGVFSGKVSTENNGGFSSVRYQTEKINTTQKSTIILHVKGDGKVYQLRIKDRVNNYYSYITEFKTSGNWETINIPLRDLYPSFRGTRLNMANFNSDSFEEIAFLIGNKKNESFILMLDTIELK
ncbi:MAG: CIA30 family protein, partial [Flavobacterium sp.]